MQYALIVGSGNYEEIVKYNDRIANIDTRLSEIAIALADSSLVGTERSKLYAESSSLRKTLGAAEADKTKFIMDTLYGGEYFVNQEKFGEMTSKKLIESYGSINKYALGYIYAKTQDEKDSSIVKFGQETLSAIGVNPGIVNIAVYLEKDGANAKYNANDNTIYLNSYNAFSQGENSMMSTIVHEYVHFAQAYPEKAPIYSNSTSQGIINKNKILYISSVSSNSLYKMQHLEIQSFYIANEVRRALERR